MMRSVALTILLLMPLAVMAAGVKLAPGVPVVVPAGTPAAVLMAVEDLRRDLAKVLGVPSPVVAEIADLRGRSAIVLLGSGGAAGLHDPKIVGREAHGIHVGEHAGAAHVILEGADPRGLIYAIYSFSDEFLNVPPLWYWADWVPARREVIDVPSDTRRIFPPAYVRWRAWLNNDTDFLTPWQRRAPDNDHAMLETVLRLKYNTFELGGVANLRPDAPRYAVQSEAAKAHARGLVITHHHTSPLGSNLSSWENFWKREGKGDVPPLSVKNAENLKTFWRYHVETAHRAGLEVVWTLVFRGSRDIPFWETFKDGPTEPADRGRVISEMLQAQVAVVKEVTGDPAPNLRTTFYNEGTTLLAAGLLHPPPEPTLMWNFVAARRDHFPPEDLRKLKAPPDRLIAYYLNFQFTSTGSHLAPAEGPWKMAANYRIVDGTGAQPLAFSVVNAGNNREHLAELSANAEMLWRFKEFEAGAFLRKFCARYYGTAQADAAATLYRDYYAAFWTQKRADIPGFDRQYIFQDMRYARAVEMLLKDMAAEVNRPNPLEGHPLDDPSKGSVGYFRVELQPGDSSQIDALLRGTAESGKKFAAVAAQADALQPRIAAEGRVFFDDNLRARARLMLGLNELLHETTLAYQAQGKRDQRREHLSAALRGLDAVQVALDSTRHGTFDQWYAGDRVFGLAALRASLKDEIGRVR